MQERQNKEIVTKQEKKKADESTKSNVDLSECGDGKMVVQLSKESEKALLNAVLSQDSKLNQLQKRINDLTASFNAYQEIVQGNINATIKAFVETAEQVKDDIYSYSPQVALRESDKAEVAKLVYALSHSSLSKNINQAIEEAGKSAENLLDNGRRVENEIRELMVSELEKICNSLEKSMKDYEERLKVVSQEQQKLFTTYLDDKIQDYQNRRQWSDYLNHIVKNWRWYIWVVIISFLVFCLWGVRSCSRASEREENARLWIEHGRLWDYYREKNPKTSKKIMEEFYKTHNKYGELGKKSE